MTASIRRVARWKPLSSIRPTTEIGRAKARKKQTACRPVDIKSSIPCCSVSPSTGQAAPGRGVWAGRGNDTLPAFPAGTIPLGYPERAENRSGASVVAVRGLGRAIGGAAFEQSPIKTRRPRPPGVNQRFCPADRAGGVKPERQGNLPVQPGGVGPSPSPGAASGVKGCGHVRDKAVYYRRDGNPKAGDHEKRLPDTAHCFGGKPLCQPPEPSYGRGYASVHATVLLRLARVAPLSGAPQPLCPFPAVPSAGAGGAGVPGVSTCPADAVAVPGSAGGGVAGAKPLIRSSPSAKPTTKSFSLVAAWRKSTVKIARNCRSTKAIPSRTLPGRRTQE